MVGRLREGLAYVRGTPVLFRLLAMQALAFVFFTLVLPIEIVYAKETLDAGDSGYGALLSSWGVGHGGRQPACSWRRRGESRCRPSSS